ncbi:MAG: hypothetical protein ACE5GS_15195, partial [Kiloniellaceae bacterium]
MPERLGSAVLELTTDETRLRAGIDSARQRAERLGAAFKRIGGQISLFVSAPATGLLAATAKLADAQIKAERQLATALSLSGGAVEQRLEGMKAFAAGLQRITTVGDETTLQNLQVAKSMGLTDEQARRAAENAIGLSKAFGINEQSAIRYTAALEQGDTTMLNRYIPTLRQLEEDTARQAEAQRILAGAFQAAVTEAQVGLGPLQQMRNDLGDLGETFGAIVLPAIADFARSVRDVIAAVQELSPRQKEWLAGLAGALAVGGPILLGLGLLATAIGALLSPIGLVAVAIIGAGGLVAAFVVFKDDVTRLVRKTVEAIEKWFVDKFGGIVESIEGAINKVKRFFKGLGDFVAFNSVVPDMVDAIEREFARLDRVMVAPAADATGEVADAFDRLGRRSSDLVRRIGDDLARGELDWRGWARGAVDAIADVIRAQTGLGGSGGGLGGLFGAGLKALPSLFSGGGGATPLASAAASSGIITS